MSEQHNQRLIDQLNQIGKTAAMAAASISAFIDYMKAIRSANWYLQQYYKNCMMLRYHVHMPPQKEKRVIKKLRTRRDLKAIKRSAENRREMKKIIYGLKLKRIEKP